LFRQKYKNETRAYQVILDLLKEDTIYT